MDLYNSRILLTGATGLIGGEIYRRLPNKNNVYCLCRNTKTAKERIKKRLNAVLGFDQDLDSVNIVEGDLTKANWGLKEFDYDIVIHCAGETSFLYKKSCIKTNINGINYLVDLIKSSDKKPFLVYFGTASSHGDIKDTVIDESFKGVDTHHNVYTKSKKESENIIKSSLSDYLILKPTIVLGDNVVDKSLATSIGWAFYVSRYFDCLPLIPDSKMDYLPVSYVGEVFIKLLKKEKLKYNEYFISCGKNNNINAKDIIDFCNKYAKKEKPTVLDKNYKGNYKGRQRLFYRGLKYYVPFINMNIAYNNARLLEELPEMKKVPLLFDYLDFVLDQIDDESAWEESKNP